MKSKKLYAKLDKDFITPEMSDKWFEHMKPLADFLTDSFKKRSMGLVCDFADDINKVYTAVFPSKKVLQEILDNKTQDAMLFVHHPMIWDIRKAPESFQQMDRELLEQLKQRRISIYNLHVPLDNFGEYGTSKTLADALGIKIEKPFAKYRGSLAGVIGQTSSKDIQSLKQRLEKVITHRAKLHPYGSKEIKRIAVVAGGGNDLDILTEITEEGADTLVTGISALNSYSKPAHDYAKEHKINIIGGTHYSTEMIACKKMCQYFKKQGLPCKFLRDKPVMEDL